MYVLEEKILPVSEKLKAIRKHLGLKQEQLTNGSISRSLISYIENGKVELKKDTAEVIAKCLQKILKEKKIELKVDSDYLMSDKLRQAEILLSRYCEELRQYIDNSDRNKIEYLIDKIEKSFSKWDIPKKKALFFDLVADFYYEIFEYNESYIYYIKALENNIKNNNLHNYANILTKIARCCIKTNRYTQSIKYNDYALAILKVEGIEDINLYKRCLFNNALAYNFSKEYDKCLNNLIKLDEFLLNITIKGQIDIAVLKANCYRSNKYLDKAKESYNRALEVAKRNNKLKEISMIYLNLGVLHKECHNVETAIEYDKKALSIKERIRDHKISKNLLNLGEKYMLLEQYNLAEKYLLRGINETHRNQDSNTFINLHIKLLEVYISTGEHYLTLKLIDEIKNRYKKYGGLSNSKRNLKDTETFLLKAANYLIHKDVGLCKELLKLLERGRSNED